MRTICTAFATDGVAVLHAAFSRGSGRPETDVQQTSRAHPDDPVQARRDPGDPRVSTTS